MKNIEELAKQLNDLLEENKQLKAENEKLFVLKRKFIDDAKKLTPNDLLELFVSVDMLKNLQRENEYLKSNVNCNNEKIENLKKQLMNEMNKYMIFSNKVNELFKWICEYEQDWNKPYGYTITKIKDRHFKNKIDLIEEVLKRIIKS